MHRLSKTPLSLPPEKETLNIIKFVKNKFKSLLYQFVNIFGYCFPFSSFLSWLVYIILI